MSVSCSVVIPAYNCERYLETALRSACGQTMRDIEILVVDDCSQDDTAGIAARLMLEDARIRYAVLPHNAGVSAARNFGVQQARGAWIAFLDSDDAWVQDKLERQFALQANIGAELLYTGARCLLDDGSTTERVFHVPPRTTYDNLLKGNDIICSSVLVKRDWLLRFPMERSDLHEDYICWLRLLQNECLAAGLDEPLVLYRLAAGSKSRNKWNAARMTWRVHQYMGIPLYKRFRLFGAYILHGLRRYYG